jgi:hypothetical protein
MPAAKKKTGGAKKTPVKPAADKCGTETKKKKTGTKKK